MTIVRLKHIHRFKDRTGRVRFYLRRPGFKAVALPGPEGSPEFMAAYYKALKTGEPDQPAAKAGTLDALAVLYYGSAYFTQLGASTQIVYRRIVDGLRRTHGTISVAMLDAKAIRSALHKRAKTPAAANHFLRVMKTLMKLAVENEWRPDNPATGIDRLREKAEGIPTWSEDDIRAFEARWPIGTKERLAFALLLHTAQRKSDVIRMGRKNLKGEGIEVRQIKTKATLVLPIHPELRAALDLLPEGQMTFIMTAFGKPYSPTGFYNWFRDAVRAAGLPDGRSPHGLRKATARRLAEAGCSAHQIAAVTGHRTLSEVQRYTRAADQERLAIEAFRVASGGKK